MRAASPKTHVFVAGVQRSGTNMLMHALERSLATDVYHETDRRAFDSYEMRDRRTIEQLARRSRPPVFVIKALCEGDMLDELLDRLRPSKAVWMLRRYEDCVNSAAVSFKSLPRSVAALVADRNAAGWRGRGMSDRTYDIVRHHYHSGINDASAIALFWYLRNVLFFERGLDRDPRVMIARYETMVHEPDIELRRVCEFIGIRYSPWIARKVVTTSVGRRASPLVEPRIRDLCDALTARFVAVASDA